MRSPEHPGREEDEALKMGTPADDEVDLSNLEPDGEMEIEEEDLEDEDIEDDVDLNLITAMAELDAEAAEAYRIAAEYTDQVHFRTMLEQFRADHLRHVETFNRLLSDAGAPEVSTELDEESSAVTMLAASMGTMGVRATLLAMIANEQLTNASYQASTELPFEEDVARILEEHFADEQRHLEWLSEQESRVRDDEMEAEADV